MLSNLFLEQLFRFRWGVNIKSHGYD